VDEQEKWINKQIVAVKTYGESAFAEPLQAWSYLGRE
jgi:hypothetical protein